MLTKHWLVAPKAPDSLLRQYAGIGPILAQVLYNRGFHNPTEAFNFLQARDFASNPFNLKGMNEAVSRLRHAIKKREPIVVYGDFDADGVTSTVLLVQVLKALNAVVKPYIPHRVDEGYGLNSKALMDLAREGAKVVVTVDCGIRSVDEVEDGKAAGLDIIITDHHSVGPQIPDAYAVINPKQEDCKYPEDMLAGVGVTFRLAQALLTVAGRMNARPQQELQPEDLLDLVAIGTVADIMPLNRAENRALVHHGLDVLNRAQRPGIQALIEVAGVKPGDINTMSIGFALGPRINAAGRLESAMLAYNLLSAPTTDEATKLAQQVQALNTKRQEITRSTQDLIRAEIEATEQHNLPLIFAAHPEFQPGIVGLVAGRLAEEYFRPAIVMEEGHTESRASCRSIPQFDITHALDQCADLLVRHGGHAQAAGFTVLNRNVPELKRRLMEIARNVLDGQELAPMLEVDAEVDLQQLSQELVEELEWLEPTGHANPSPVLMTRKVRVVERRLVGRDSRHLKLRIARSGQAPLDAIAFGFGSWAADLPEYVDVAYQLEVNEWNGNRTLQLNVQDLRPVSDR